MLHTELITHDSAGKAHPLRKPLLTCSTFIRTYQDEIFDLTADPSETTNLAGVAEYADVAEFLDDTLASWVEVSSPDMPPFPTVVETTAELLEVRNECTMLSPAYGGNAE